MSGAAVGFISWRRWRWVFSFYMAVIHSSFLLYTAILPCADAGGGGVGIALHPCSMATVLSSVSATILTVGLMFALTLPLAVGITRCWYESSMGIDSKNMVQSSRYAASFWQRLPVVPGEFWG
ncbi:hypothetical protein MJ561_23120 [Klebsiella pneumoniae]|nr:hypothetical protein MJ561_23120 [Klebsiella pneumoniae]